MIEMLGSPRRGDRGFDPVSPTLQIKEPVIEFQVPS